MRVWLGMIACLLALLTSLWGGVAEADGGYVTIDSTQDEIAIAIATAELVDTPAEQPAPEPDVQSLIVDAARRFGLDERILLRIAWCESRYDAYARGAAGLAGVFQFAPITWSWAAESAGYAGASPFDVRANIDVAAWLYKKDGPKHWGCK